MFRIARLCLLLPLLLATPASAGGAEKAVARLIETGAARIALLHADNAAGRAARDSVSAALARRGRGIVALATYRAGSGKTEAAVRALSRARPDTILILGPQAPAIAARLRAGSPVPGYAALPVPVP